MTYREKYISEAIKIVQQAFADPRTIEMKRWELQDYIETKLEDAK